MKRIVTIVASRRVSQVIARILQRVEGVLGFHYDRETTRLYCESDKLIEIAQVMDQDFPTTNNLTWFE